MATTKEWSLESLGVDNFVNLLEESFEMENHKEYPYTHSFHRSTRERAPVIKKQTLR